MSNKKFLSVIVAVLLIFQTFAVVACAKNGGSDAPAASTDSSNSGGKTPLAVEEKYRITYYTGSGASQVDPVIGVTAGSKITAPEDPRWALHTFAGWYTDYGTYENAFDFDQGMPAKNLVLYAKWDSDFAEDELIAYEQNLMLTSEEGHFYVHYLRFNDDPAEYEKLDVWSWPYQQVGRSFDWNRDENGNIVFDAIAGATCDIDLTVKYNDAGKVASEPQEMQYLTPDAVAAYAKGETGGIFDEDNYMNQRLGFLIVYKASKNISGQHWQSDGGADQLIYIKDALWENGSLHVFCVQDNVADHTYHLTDQQEIVNPYADDDGTHVSAYNVNSSVTLKANDATSLTDTVSGVGYQIMVSSFADSDGDGIGDIRGIIENFDYLKKLSVDVLWLTPIQLSDSYHGYDIIDYKAVDPKFGTMDDYKELLTLCHDNDMKVIMDLVLNHTSTNNVWFKRSVKMEKGSYADTLDGREIDFRNFYQWKNNKKNPDLSEAWYKYSEYDYSYYAKFSPSMPELNYDNKDTRDAIVDVAKYWLGIMGDGTGVDGFRIDAVKHIYMADEIDPDPSDIIIQDYDEETKTDYSSNLTKNINFFTYFANEIKAEYPNAYLVGENFDGHAYNVAPYFAAYDGMLNFYMYYQFGDIAKYPSKAGFVAGGNDNSENAAPKGINTSLLKYGEWDYEAFYNVQKAYRGDGLVPGSGSGVKEAMDSLFTSNHDIPRLMNNMVDGAVTASNAQYGQRMAKAVVATMMTMPGISWIYYGDEIGMSSNFYAGENATSSHADRAYRQPFKWTNDAHGKYITDFSISGDTTLYVDWDEYNKRYLEAVDVQDGKADSYLNTVRYWTKAKSEDEVLRYGDYYYYRGFSDQWGQGVPLFAFTRNYQGKTYVVVTNFSEYNYFGISGIIGAGTLLYKTGGDLSGGYDSVGPGETIVVKIAG